MSFRIFFCFLFSLSFCFSFAQKSPFVVHQFVGEEVDSAERAYYELFEPADSLFDQAIITKSLFNGFRLLIIKKDGSRDSAFITSDSIYAIKKHITNIDAYYEKKVEQLAGKVYQVELESGLKITGRITKAGKHAIVIHDKNGRDKVVEPRLVKASIEPLNKDFIHGSQKGDPNYTRLLVSNTSRMLKKNEAYLTNHMLFILGAGYGVTDHINIHAGTLIAAPLVANALSVRAGTELSKGLYTSAGVTALINIKGEGAYLPYISGTIGYPKAMLTVSYVHGMTNSNERGFSEIDANIFTLGATLQLTSFLSVMTDNWFLSGRGQYSNNSLKMPSFAFRFFKEDYTVDFGAYFFYATDGRRYNTDVVMLPWISCTYLFSLGH